jgi:hypothetical protein
MAATAIRGVVVPFAIFFLAFITLLYAGMLGSLGPLDLATANQLALGLWIVAPVVGGLLVRSLTVRHITFAAVVLGVVLVLEVAFVLLTGAGTAGLSNACAGIPRSPAGFVVGCGVVGATVGIGTGASLFITAWLARAGWWLPAVLLAGGLNFGAGAVAYTLFYSIVTCMHP